MSRICQAQKRFFRENGKYGTLADLRDSGLIVGDLRNHDDIDDGEVAGYKFEIVVTNGGYFAKAKTKKKSTEEPSFYVDEKSENVKYLFGEAEPNSAASDYQLSYQGEFSCRE